LEIEENNVERSLELGGRIAEVGMLPQPGVSDQTSAHILIYLTWSQKKAKNLDDLRFKYISDTV